MQIRILFFALLAALMCAAPTHAENLPIQKSWKGEIDAKVAKTVGEALVIRNQPAWEKFWKSVQPKEKTPVVDFKTQAVLIMAGKNITINFLDLNDGDIRPDADGTFDGPESFHAVTFEHKGVKSVWKKPLPKE